MKQEFIERGYLKDEFKVFHLSGNLTTEVPFHYHNFKKIMICLSSNIGYIIEGKQYELQPLDIIFIEAGEIHRPLVSEQEEYERIIIYLSDDFFKDCREADLSLCFHHFRHGDSHILRSAKEVSAGLIKLALSMTTAACDSSHSPMLLQKCRMLEFMILLNDVLLSSGNIGVSPISQNIIVMQTIHYIHSHLTEELSIPILAESVHLNKSYLMHLFKAETGYTIKDYITEKRLFYARHLIEQKHPLTEACFLSGFTNYTSFYRAYTIHYGTAPRKDVRNYGLAPDAIPLE